MFKVPETENHPLKIILKQRGIRQVQLAKALGISVSSLAAYLNNYRTPPIEVQRRLEEIQKTLGQEQ